MDLIGLEQEQIVQTTPTRKRRRWRKRRRRRNRRRRRGEGEEVRLADSSVCVLSISVVWNWKLIKSRRCVSMIGPSHTATQPHSHKPHYSVPRNGGIFVDKDILQIMQDNFWISVFYTYDLRSSVSELFDTPEIASIALDKNPLYIQARVWHMIW